MTKHQHKGAGGYDRRAIMRNAHKRYRDGQRLGLAWPFAQCLATAWQAARIRQGDDTAATMRRIAGMIDDHLSRRITLAPEIGKGRINEKDRLGFCLSPVAGHRASRNGRRPVCRNEGAR
jgi:hypothetical protein